MSFCLSSCFYFYVSGRLVPFPDLGEVAFCRRCPMHPSSTVASCHPSKLYAQGVPPMRSVWILLLWQADYVGSLVSLLGPWSSCLPGPALRGDCWPLIGRTGSPTDQLQNPRDSRDYAGSLVGEARSCG